MKSWRLAWRQMRRDLAAGEVRILIAALVLAVMSVTAVGFITDRANRALVLEANRLLGGDAVLRADQPIGPNLRRLADVPGLKRTETRAFASMVGVRDAIKLGEIRAVAPGFPLRGELSIATSANAAGTVVHGVPAPGSAWMSRSGAQALGASIGDRVSVGSTNLRLAALVTAEPDAALDVFSTGPKLFINLQDLPSTRLEQPGSRITYRLIVAGEPAAVERFTASVKALLQRGQRLETAADARPEVRSALDRAGRFLGLAALISVVLAAVAVAMAARRHSARHLAGSAVMRCLGASQRTLVEIHVGELLIIGLLASVAGVLLAFFLQAVVAGRLAAALGVALPPASLRPMLEGIAVGLTVLLAFGIPPVLALRRVSALRVLRHDLETAEPSALVAAALGLGGLGLLLWWKAGSAALGSAMLLGIVATLAVLGGLGYALIVLVRRLRSRLQGPWRYGLANVSRRPAASVAQIASLGLGLMVLLLLTFVRTDLVTRWQQQLPADAPNRFLINVQPEQVQPLIDTLVAEGVGRPILYPLVRGRLVELNGKPVTGADFGPPGDDGDRARRLAEREFNLSTTTSLRSDNVITAGKFWTPAGPSAPEVSVEEDFAETLGWKLGDRVAFDIAGQRYAAKVTSLRKVDWESFKPNFFVLASPRSLHGFPASYVGAVHAPANQARFTNTLVSRFPNLSIVDIDAIMVQVRRTADQVSAVVEAVFYFSLAAGVLVLMASVSASQDERLLEGAVMRVLGGSRRQLLLAQASEFAVIGLLTGLTAAIAATVLAGVVAREVFDLSWTPDWRLVATSTAIGIVAATLAGMLATRRVLGAPPTVTLRQLQG